jgi:hypothetical protein
VEAVAVEPDGNARPAPTSATGATPLGDPGETATPPPVAFVDSSALVALADRDDASHAAAVAAYRDLVGAGYKLFTTNYVVAETFDLLRAGLGGAVARQWLRDSRLAVYHADEADEAKARRLVLERGEGRELSLTEAVSLVVMDRLGVTDAFAVDQRFLAETG